MVVADFNNDGWPDFATAVTISDGDPEASISHPRIFMNQGAPGGNWQGFRFVAASTPQLFVLNGSGLPTAVATPGRFCSIAAGDVDGDGDADLYLGDYDGGSFTDSEPAGVDVNDRLWINNGAGVFIDSNQSADERADAGLRLLAAASNIADMNGDGRNDVVKSTGLQTPQQVQRLLPQLVRRPTRSTASRSPMHLLARTSSRWATSTTTAVSTWSRPTTTRTTTCSTPATTGWARSSGDRPRNFSFAAGGDDGFGSQSLIADLDQDGWKDVLISDVDVDDPTGSGGTGVSCGGGTRDPPAAHLPQPGERART